MDSDNILIKAFNPKVDNPNKDNISVSKVFRGQVNPTGLIINNWRFTSLVNYVTFCEEENGVFCIVKIETMYSLN